MCKMQRRCHTEQICWVSSICSQQVSSHVRERSSLTVMMVPLKREGEEEEKEEEGEPH